METFVLKSSVTERPRLCGDGCSEVQGVVLDWYSVYEAYPVNSTVP